MPPVARYNRNGWSTSEAPNDNQTGDRKPILGWKFSLVKILLKNYSFNDYLKILFNLTSDLSPSTEEILFELYDRDKNRNVFLGLGIVGMEVII